MSRDPLNFWALNADSSKAVKATDFKFDVHVNLRKIYINLENSREYPHKPYTVRI